MTPREPSEACYALIREFEDLKLKAYLDPIGIPTVGYGHTSPSVRLWDEITKDQAETWLKSDVAKASAIVSSWVHEPLTQGQFDALVSFTFNIGPGLVDHKDGFVWLKSRDATGAPRHSSLLNLLNTGKAKTAAAEILKWTRAGGKILAGLVRRRSAEAAMFRGEATPNELST